jgi:WD40 repeat protein
MEDKKLIQLLHDGKIFVHENQHPIHLSVLYVHFSALPFTPKRTVIVEVFEDQLNDIIEVLSGRQSLWTSCLKTLEEHTHLVNCVAVSSDKSTVASGSWDKTIHIWDAQTGSRLERPS